MNTTGYLKEILQELNQAADQIAEEQAEQLVGAILDAEKIFVAGAGRSGFMAKSFAMRMMHMGLDAYVPGETVTPGYTEKDLIIIGSGSGETKSLVTTAEKAQSIGGKLAIVTLVPTSTLGKLADYTVQLPGATKDRSEDGGFQTIQPMGSLFEQMLLVFYDALILKIMEAKGLDTQRMYGKHANLE
ncbi:6-phospho-3-hexuloisomerase [Aureibacillus halotolerans]|uniref:6-phospho-3-hexuloisomerase n=1 Tax=Aureibacillus halotolerans TaxID=1508390 RepID=A0A4R6TUH5_9BACI|nr:6-phospho-3-hexuloisomerase [Aureibacillus halotolerans]TDQ37388.1 6-phospho-3-hexuloisomerase [Aureibacillus halotolerans]